MVEPSNRTNLDIRSHKGGDRWLKSSLVVEFSSSREFFELNVAEFHPGIVAQEPQMAVCSGQAWMMF